MSTHEQQALHATREDHKKEIVSHKFHGHNAKHHGKTKNPKVGAKAQKQNEHSTERNHGKETKKKKPALKRSDSSLSLTSGRGRSAASTRETGKSGVTIHEHPRRPSSASTSRRIRKKWRIISSKAASLVGSIASADSRGRPKTFPIWPEFNENDIASEKWDSAAKGKEKGKSPSLSSFEDPEGRIELPPSLKVHEWKRPVDFLEGKAPVILDENEGDFDLLKANEHLCHSELMRCIMGQITSLWNITATKDRSCSLLSARNSVTTEPGEDNTWRPWEHIYAMTKPGKWPNIAQYNHYGKYVVKLFWMGCWRKITVDDYMPFDTEGRMLLPTVEEDHKLWPMLLSKALIKIAAIDYTNSDVGSEFGDFFVIQCLTGWLPETIPLKYGHLQKVWNLLKDILPEWQRPGEKTKEVIIEPEPVVPGILIPKKERLESGAIKPDGSLGSAHKGGGKGKDGGKKKDGDKKSAVDQESSEKVEKHPETVIFATFSHPEESPARVSVLKEMADASEKLRKIGLSHLHPHPVLLTKTRDKPLKPPPPPLVIPRWKLIRPKKKRTTPSDEPIYEPEPPKPDQWLEITSIFMNHRISPLPLDPNYVKSRKSPIGPKGSRPSTGATLKNIDEDPDVKVEPPKEDGVFRAHVISKRRQSNKGRSALHGKDRKDSLHGAPSIKSHVSSFKDMEKESLESQDGGIEASQTNGRDSVSNELKLDEIKDSKTDEASTDSVNKTIWMDFEDFCKSFQTLVIFHKPSTYNCSRTTTEIKHSVSAVTPSGGTSSKKGSANVNQATSNTNIRGPGGLKEEERAPSFLFIDSVEPMDLVVSFSVLPRWAGSESERDKKMFDKESVTGASEVASVKESGNTSLPNGLLVAEPYSWKSLVVGQPILRIRTTGTRAACLTLPAGRHVLRFFFDTQLGYSLSICSTVQFVYGDEGAVMKPLLEESCRFVDTSNRIIQSIGKCIEAIGDIDSWKAAKSTLHKAHMPCKIANKADLVKHYNAWYKAFYETMKQVMEDNKVPALAFSLRSFNFDLSPQSTEYVMDPKAPVEPPEAWVSRIPTEDELGAVERLQSHWRGALARKMSRAVMGKNTVEQLTMKEVLSSAWQLIQQNQEDIGLKLLRSMLKEDPALIENYPFHKDEWNKISYADYEGTYDDQPQNTWFVMFREVFMVEEDMLCVPKLYCPLRTCSLRVVDNDTGREIMRVFQKVAPHVYTKNKRGYTFICEARSLDSPLQGGKWRLRLIGSASPLPRPISGQVNYHFKVKDNNGCYIPNDKNIILRYHVKTRSDLIGSIQFKTSKSDVYVKLQILDHDVEVVSTQGKGHVVIPAFCFYTDEKSEDRSNSRLSHHESRPLMNQPSKQIGVSGKKRTASAKSKDGKTSPKQPCKDSDSGKGAVSKPDAQRGAAEEIKTEPAVPHKYTIQAVVERNSWPLTESQWAYVQKLRELEKDEIKVYTAKPDRAVSPGAVRSGGKTSTPDKWKKASKLSEKTGKDKKTVDKESGSRPPSQTRYDYSKAFWILNVVVDDDKADDIDVKKDTDRQEQIKAEKRAWEAQQPGRAVKALQARLAYLEKRDKKTEKDADKENEEERPKSADTSEAGVSETLSLHPPTPKVIPEALDLTPFYRPKVGEDFQAQYLDNEILVEKEKMEKQLINEYERERQEVLEWREREKNERLQLKINQLRTFQEMQNKLDDARAELRKPREAYRQALMEEEKRHKEEQAERLAAIQAAAEAGSAIASAKTKKSAGKKKK